MNIFYLDPDPVVAARYHCNKHVVKMVTETAQLLSTAHRLLDGAPVVQEWTQGDSKRRLRRMHLLAGESIGLNVNAVTGKVKPFYHLGDSSTGAVMAETHVNHPQAVWVRSSTQAYKWTYDLFVALLREYTRRYGRVHATAHLQPVLQRYPRSIRIGTTWQNPPLTMPDEYKQRDTVASYRAFYAGEKVRFAKWPEGETPTWFQDLLTLK